MDKKSMEFYHLNGLIKSCSKTLCWLIVQASQTLVSNNFFVFDLIPICRISANGYILVTNPGNNNKDKTISFV